jgi:hypothetical protein
MSFKEQLIDMKACSEAIEWVGGRTLAEAWSECPRGDWMLWGLAMMAGQPGWPSHQEVVRHTCWCVRRALEHAPDNEAALLQLVDAVEAWASGTGSIRGVDNAGRSMTDVIKRARCTKKHVDEQVVAAAREVWHATIFFWSIESDDMHDAFNRTVFSERISCATCIAANTGESRAIELNAQADYLRVQVQLPNALQGESDEATRLIEALVLIGELENKISKLETKVDKLIVELQEKQKIIDKIVEYAWR